MKSITQYLEEALNAPFEKSKREYEDELVRQMSDEEKRTYLEEKKKKLKRSAMLAGLGYGGLAFGGTMLYNAYKR
jgi:hypothetical protein